MKIGDRVQHRGWFWYGTITDLPEEIKPLSHIGVLEDHKETPVSHWIPALIFDTDDFVYDFSKGGKKDENNAKRRHARKSKKRRAKR